MITKCLIFLTFAFVFFTEFLAIAEKFSAVKHMQYHIKSRTNSNFSSYSLSQILAFDGTTTVHDFLDDNQFNFNANRPTRIFVHGFYSENELMDSYAQAYLEIGDYNFIAANWLTGAVTLNYFSARHRVREVGETLAVFIDHLVSLGMNLEHLILVGHSLGAHVCGWAGKSVTSGKLPVIIALDPALPMFFLSPRFMRHRLASTDARYVQVIHTCGGILGIRQPIGHADFYPNYGCHQPGCTGFSSCKNCLKLHLHSEFVLRHYLFIRSFQMYAPILAFMICFKRVFAHHSGP